MTPRGITLVDGGSATLENRDRVGSVSELATVPLLFRLSDNLVSGSGLRSPAKPLLLLSTFRQTELQEFRPLRTDVDTAYRRGKRKWQAAGNPGSPLPVSLALLRTSFPPARSSRQTRLAK